MPSLVMLVVASLLATVLSSPVSGEGLDDVDEGGVASEPSLEVSASSVAMPPFESSLVVDGPGGETEEVPLPAAESTTVDVDVDAVEVSADGQFDAPVVDVVFDNPGLGEGEIESGLAGADRGPVRIGESPFQVRLADRLASRLPGFGNGRTVRFRVPEDGLARSLSPLGMVGELSFDGFGATGPLAGDGVRSGWVLEVDRSALGDVPIGALDRMAVFVWGGCDEAGECLIVDELTTEFDPEDGVYRAELPAYVVSGEGLTALDSSLLADGVGVGQFRAGDFAFASGGGSQTWTGIAPSVGGASGTYAASDPTSLLSWQVGSHTGYAESTYGVPLPPAVGPSPAVALSYSSGQVDGLNSSTNVQPGSVGVGWDLGVPVIRRVTRNCAGGTIDHSGAYEGNLCLPTAYWNSGQRDAKPNEGFTLSMDGVTGRLVPTGQSGSHPRYLNADYVAYELETKNDMRIWKVQHDDALGTGTGDTGGLMGEWWEVTTSDGTLFVFGRNWALKPTATPSSTPLRDFRTVDTSVALNSVQVVPVMVETGVSGDPASQCLGLVCPIEVAWFLDQMIDTSGNMSVHGYWKESNYYRSKFGALYQHKAYDKAINPQWIDYGLTFGTAPVSGAQTSPAFRVQFDYRVRNEAESYSAPPSQWYDTPVDLVCGTSGCTHDSPSFFSHHRLGWITTKAGASIAHQFVLTNSWPQTPDGSERKMWLDSIQQVGNDGTTMPPVTFSSVFLANRVNHPTGVSPMSMPRVAGIRSELGGDVTFTYGQPYPPSPVNGSACSKTTTPPSNGYIRLPCNMFPAYDAFTGGGGWVLWNSYVVTKEKREGRFGQNADYEELTYNYDTPPDWAYTGNWGLTETATAQCSVGWGCNHWNEYRGHREVSVTNRIGEKTRHFTYTGMWDDRYSLTNTAPLGQVTPSNLAVKVTSPNGQQYDNRVWLRGLQHGNGLYRANGWTRETMVTLTAMAISNNSSYPISYRVTSVGEYQHVWDTVWNHSDGERWVISVFDTDTRLQYVQDYGLVADPSDDTTTFYDYTTNNNDWIIGLPHLIATKAGIVTTNPWGNWLSATALNYDNQAYGVAPIQGRVTVDQTQLRHDGSQNPVWKVVSYTHHTKGQIASVIESGAGTTTYQYDSTWGFQNKVDGPLAGTDDVTDYVVDPRYGAQISIDPPDTAATVITLDGLGRTSTVTLPGAPAASYIFDYSLDPNRNRAAWVRTRQLREGTTSYTIDYNLVDGFGRSVQTQTPTADGTSTIIASSVYGSDGALRVSFQPSIEAGAPDGLFRSYNGATLVRTFITNTDWGQTYTNTYDAATLVSSSWVRPEGLETLISDPNGQTTIARSTIFGDPAWFQDAGGATTTYGYNARRQQPSSTDPVGNIIHTYYDNWETSPTRIVDPDLQTRTYTYDTAGRPATFTDARGHLTTVNYLPDSQPSSVTSGGTTVASWAYSTTGRVQSSTFTNLNTAGVSQGTVTKAYGYDTRGRMNATTWTIPGLPSGSQSINYTHRESGAIDTVTFPNGDVFDYGYNTLEQPTSLTHNGATIASAVTYNPRRQLTSLTAGTPTWPVTNQAVLSHVIDHENHTGRIEHLQAVGLDQDPAVEDHLTRIYRAVLDRDPDPTGWVYWMTQYATGTPAANIAQWFTDSTEYTTTWAGYVDTHTSQTLDVTTNNGFVNWAYDHILNTPPANRDVTGWVNNLTTGGWTRSQLLDVFAGDAAAIANPNIGSTDATTVPATVTNTNADVAHDLAYTWDDAGNLTTTHDTSAGINQWQCYHYNTRYQLTSAYTRGDNNCTGHQAIGPDTYAVAYTYNTIGNITSAAGNGTVNGNYTYHPAHVHAATQAGTNTYTYDQAGNQTTRTTSLGTQNLTYDLLNRLNTITGAGPNLTILYDADGTRVKRTLDTTNTYYLTDTYETTTDGPTTTIRLHPALAGRVGAAIDGTFHATALGQLGSTNLTRDITGATTTQRYTPYGSIRGASSVNSLPIDQTFTGQTTDPGTGLIDYNARHYDAEIARFTQPDTVLVDQNRFTYTRNNPLRYVDPTGHEPCPRSGCTSDNSGGRSPCLRSQYSQDGNGACGRSAGAMRRYLDWERRYDRQFAVELRTRMGREATQGLIRYFGIPASILCAGVCGIALAGATTWADGAAGGDPSIGSEELLAVGGASAAGWLLRGAGSLLPKLSARAPGRITLYHGTTPANAAGIRANGIDLSRANPRTDFGPGFYTTTDPLQALSRARGNSAGVLSFSIPRSGLAGLFGRTFRSGGDDYAMFVRNLRGGAMHPYDYVSGPVLRNPIEFYSGKPAQTFGDQISFHTARAIELLEGGLR